MIPNAEFVERVVEFAQAEMSNISMMEKTKWAEYMARIIVGEQKGMYYYPKDPSKEEEWEEVIAFQQEWLKCLNWLVDKLDAEWMLSYRVPYIFSWGAMQNKGYFTSLALLGEEEMEVRVHRWEPKGYEPNYPHEKMVFPPGAHSFFVALSHFSTSSLMRCLHCTRIFFNPTKRKKIYCSQPCQNAEGMRRFRKKKEG